jgi:hypothetical protein
VFVFYFLDFNFGANFLQKRAKSIQNLKMANMSNLSFFLGKFIFKQPRKIVFKKYIKVCLGQ